MTDATDDATDTNPSNAAKLYTKLAAAAAAVTHVPKSGYNKEQKYDYATDADVSFAVRTACLEAGVLVMMIDARRIDSVEITSKSGTKGERVTVQVDVRFCDTETGVYGEVRSLGSGFDYGDKAVAKAITGAVKYALLKGLCLPTGDDPEADESTDREPAKVTKGKSGASIHPTKENYPTTQPPAKATHADAAHKELGEAIKEKAFDMDMAPAALWMAAQKWAQTNMKFTPQKITDLSPVQAQRVEKWIREMGDETLSLDQAVEDHPAHHEQG